MMRPTSNSYGFTSILAIFLRPRRRGTSINWINLWTTSARRRGDIERVGNTFPTLFICVQRRVSQAPLNPKGGLEVGPATASLRLSCALPRYRRARSLAFQALLIREASSAPPARFWTWGWSHTGILAKMKKARFLPLFNIFSSLSS